MRLSTSSESIRSTPKHLDLDAAAVAQTKVQIGNLVSEIAEFAKNCESPSAFYPAMLSRLVTAMAGTGAGVWQQSLDGSWQLIQSSNLPESLILDSDEELGLPTKATSDSSIDRLQELVDKELDTPTGARRRRIERSHRIAEAMETAPTDRVSFERKPSLEHLAILECVSRERQPVLIPPGDIAANRERPTNPLQQCLIYSPIPIESAKDSLWLQVIQPPSGGIASQRGYLRFVAQIADLTADFLKTFRLRQFENESRLYSASQSLLDAAAKPGDATERLAKMLQQLRDFSGADQLFLVQRTSRLQPWQVVKASGLRDFDPRSEGSQCISELCSWVVPKTSVEQPWLYCAPDRRADGNQLEASASESTMPRDRFMAVFSAATVAWLPLFGGITEAPLGVGCVAYWSWPTKNAEQVSLEALTDRTRTLGKLGLTLIRLPSLRLAIERSTARSRSMTSFFQECLASRWTHMAFAALILVGIAMIPVPLRIIAPASLEPQLQHLHYAPLDARVVKVHVDYGESVTAGQLLVELEDRNLSNLLDEATSQHLKSKERQRDIEARLLRSDRLPNDIRDELEGELESLRALSGSELGRVEALKKQIDLLAIRASKDGVIATWNARQLLQDRPVRAGQMLLLVQQPEGPWSIEARLPQREVGKLLRAVEKGMPTAQATLSSHPNQPIQAVYQPTQKPIVLSHGPGTSQEPALCVRFTIASEELPHKNAGSSAQISIDIGRGTLAWSVLGDAVTSLWAKVRLWI
jgi:Biotin-lipoyl like